MLVYRRSIAEAVLGTDDPETVAAAVADWNKFYETAEQMRAAGYYMYSGRADTYRVYANNVSAPWVDGNTVVVDPSMMSWVDRSMQDTREKINHNVPGQWIDEWNKDMGPDSKVFCFFLPAWGPDVCIKPNVEGTNAAQDWAASISLANVSPYDQGCTEEFQNTFGDYFNGRINLEKAKENFAVAIGERYPELKSGGVRRPE